MYTILYRRQVGAHVYRASDRPNSIDTPRNQPPVVNTANSNASDGPKSAAAIWVILARLLNERNSLSIVRTRFLIGSCIHRTPIVARRSKPFQKSRSERVHELVSDRLA